MPTHLPALIEAIRQGQTNMVDRGLNTLGLGEPAPTLRDRWQRAWRCWRHRRLLRAALQTAAEVGHLPSVERLLPLASPRATDSHGRTPFLLATLYGHDEVALRLFGVSDVHQGSALEHAPVVLAAKAGLLRTVERLVVRSRTREHRDRQNQALAEAAGQGLTAMVQTLLPHADPQAHGDQGKTALIRAAEKGSPDCVNLLLPHSNVQATDHRGMNALMHAASNGHTEVVSLLAPSTDLKARQTNGQNALHLAAHRGNARCVAILLHGSDPDEQDHLGWTPLMLAASSWLNDGPAVRVDVQALELLLSVSNPGLRNQHGQTAFDLALEEAVKWQRPWHAFHWARVDLLMFHEPDPGKRAQAWQTGGVEHLPRWAAHQERQALNAVFDVVGPNGTRQNDQGPIPLPMTAPSRPRPRL